MSTDWLAYGDQTDRIRRRILYCARHRFAWSNHLHVRRTWQLAVPEAFPRLGYPWHSPRPRSAPAVPAVVVNPAPADEHPPTFVQVFFDWMFWFQPSLTSCLSVRELHRLFGTARTGSFRQPRLPRMLRAAPAILPIAIAPGETLLPPRRRSVRSSRTLGISTASSHGVSGRPRLRVCARRHEWAVFSSPSSHAIHPMRSRLPWLWRLFHHATRTHLR